MSREPAPEAAGGGAAGVGVAGVARRMAGWLIAAACLIWVFHDVKPATLWSGAVRMSWRWVPLAIVADFLGYLAQGCRWRLLLPARAGLGVTQTTRAVYAGLFTNELLPARAGELVRAYLVHSWSRVEYSSVLSTILVERILDGVWLAIAVGVLALLVPLPERLLVAGDILGAAVLAALLAWAFLLWRARRRGGETGGEAGARSGGRWIRAMANIAGQLGRTGPTRRLLAAFLLSCLVPLGEALALWCLMRGAGLGISLPAGLAVAVVMRLGAAVPSAPGNLGTFQFFCVVGLTLFGVSRESATAFSVTSYILMTVPLLLLGFTALAGSGRSLAEVRREAAALFGAGRS